MHLSSYAATTTTDNATATDHDNGGKSRSAGLKTLSYGVFGPFNQLLLQATRRSRLQYPASASSSTTSCPMLPDTSKMLEPFSVSPNTYNDDIVKATTSPSFAASPLSMLMKNNMMKCNRYTYPFGQMPSIFQTFGGHLVQDTGDLPCPRRALKSFSKIWEDAHNTAHGSVGGYVQQNMDKWISERGMRMGIEVDMGMDMDTDGHGHGDGGGHGDGHGDGHVDGYEDNMGITWG